MKMKLFTDGGARGNPGPAAYAFVLCSDDDKVMKDGSSFLGFATNNEAEYKGLIAGLTAAKEAGADKIDVTMDSELVVRQMQGAYAVRSPNLLPLYNEAKVRFLSFSEARIQHARREHPLIRRADALLNAEMDSHADRK